MHGPQVIQTVQRRKSCTAVRKRTAAKYFSVLHFVTRKAYTDSERVLDAFAWLLLVNGAL